MKKLGFKKVVGILGLCMLVQGMGNGMVYGVQPQAPTTAFPGSIVLGRPTCTQMTASILSQQEGELYVEWGGVSGKYSFKTKVMHVTQDQPTVIVMDQLVPEKTYYYRVGFKAKGKSQYDYTKEYSFATPKGAGESFNFTIQSDSHLLNKADKELYTQSMQQMKNLSPDFIFDLGDTFLNDKDVENVTYEQVDQIYRQQLPYFDEVTRTAPLFLTIGNHEGEFGGYLDGTMNNVAAMSTKARTTYYPNPVPNAFYSGNSEQEAWVGNPQNYYAFTWGDALFVSIDPYRYSEVTPYGADDGWGWTLGKAQYDWFRTTLEQSDAKYKFVFSHHAIGNTRGGKEIAKLYEWGGYDKKGQYLFDQKRPGWGKPIQQIMKDTGVTIFFQGHDHLFAREEVDGVIYQTLPKPAEKIADNQSNYDAYPDADKLMNSGFLNVTVSPEAVKVDYIRNYYVSSDPQESNTGLVYSYTVDEEGKVTILKQTQDNLSTYGKNDTVITKEPSKKEPTNGNKKNPTQKKEDKDKPTKPTTQAYMPQTEVPSGGFSVAIQADSHLDENTDKTLYAQTLAQIRADQPQFVIDLGDTFMAEKFAKTQQEVEARYVEAKSYFDQLGNIPLYLVTGNHEGENGWNSSKNGQSMMTWTRAMRLKYFGNTPQQQIISGNTTTANYYTFVYGDAQFIVLDPYTYTTQRGKSDAEGWYNTLGSTQYNWLKKTLEESTAKYKFVFIHNLVGGSGKDSRGGAEASTFFEWGGKNLDGTDAFASKRPGWEMPIHDLLVKYDVDIVFHGHDHFYGKQERDGIIYQLVPQPGTPGNSINDAEAYSYIKGEFLPSAGYLRLVVTGEKTIVEYVYTDSSTNQDNKVLTRYEVLPH